ncbi:hypothetical protein QR680_006908 [Steinernema hermaphroditum]|uniref:BPTI/Kunitz inhibitor domain-containing protein n=1 Tax=Steinernema hermaphroditum TaxID=289476 RepID=A0AA39HYI3_9BILA|nr:hypothetical protein QR680_006908 [Steinernema hermaphroditum]
MHGYIIAVWSIALLFPQSIHSGTFYIREFPTKLLGMEAQRVSTVDYKDCAYQTIKLKALGFRYNQRTKECISFQVVHGQFGVGPEDGEKHYYISRSDDDMCPRDVVQDMLDDRKNKTTLLK